MQAFATRTSRKRFQRAEQLFAEGDPCTGLFLVATGKIRIFKLSSAGREQILALEGPGSSFAELPVFDGGNYPAAASALEDTEVLFISRKDFSELLPRASRCRAQSHCGCGIAAPAPGRDH